MNSVKVRRSGLQSGLVGESLENLWDSYSHMLIVPFLHLSIKIKFENNKN